jgi:hypothetical protein
MPTTTTKTKTTTKKGKGLTKKVGPFPVYVYLIGVGIVVLYLYYRHRNSSGQSVATSAGGYVQPQPASGVDVVPSGNANTTTGDTGTSSSQPVDFPNDYATQTDLASAIDTINNDTVAAIAGITFPQPTVNITVPTGPGSPVSKTTTASKTAAKTAAAVKTPTRYYTYKKNVPLRKGQTLHFTSGKGYYAA